MFVSTSSKKSISIPPYSNVDSVNTYGSIISLVLDHLLQRRFPSSTISILLYIQRYQSHHLKVWSSLLTRLGTTCRISEVWSTSTLAEFKSDNLLFVGRYFIAALFPGQSPRQLVTARYDCNFVTAICNWSFNAKTTELYTDLYK